MSPNEKKPGSGAEQLSDQERFHLRELLTLQFPGKLEEVTRSDDGFSVKNRQERTTAYGRELSVTPLGWSYDSSLGTYNPATWWVVRLESYQPPPNNVLPVDSNGVAHLPQQQEPRPSVNFTVRLSEDDLVTVERTHAHGVQVPPVTKTEFHELLTDLKSAAGII